jgi:hypothetical protein
MSCADMTQDSPWPTPVADAGEGLGPVTRDVRSSLNLPPEANKPPADFLCGDAG